MRIPMQRLSSTTQLCGLLHGGSESDHAHRHQAIRDDRLLLGDAPSIGRDVCFSRVSVEAPMSFETTDSNWVAPFCEKRTSRLPLVSPFGGLEQAMTTESLKAEIDTEMAAHEAVCRSRGV